MTPTSTVAMTGSDSVLWVIERDPQLRSTVTAIARLDRAPDQTALRRRVEEAVQAVPRLRQRVAAPLLGLGNPRWEEDPFFDLDYHLRAVRAVSGDARWLLDFAALLAARGFDRDRPLWELVTVEGLEGGGAALVQKVHHSLTDGVGGIELMLSLLDVTRHPRRPPPSTAAQPEPDPALSPFTRAARQSFDTARSVGARLPSVLRSMAQPATTVGDLWRLGVSVTRLLAPGGPRRSPLLVGHGTNWYFDVYEQPMEALTSAARAAGGTVNDVFVAALAGAMHRYHLKHGYDVDNLRLTLPVSLRRDDDPVGGNHFTPVRFTLPISEQEPLKRVQQIGALCRRWTHEPALPLTDSIATVLSLLPAAVTSTVMGSMLRGTDLVATNVPGVPGRCYMAGAELVSEHAFAPLSGAAVNVSLLSHAGTACIGANMDRAAVGDPDVLMDCLSRGFDEVVALGDRVHTGGSDDA